jgi:ABC-type bacteriocin/lantibiotic exporter with double-glycine peptidase domain
MVIGSRLKHSIKQVRTNRISIHSLLVERLSAITTIKAMGQEQKEINKINNQANKLEQNIARQGIFLGLLRGVGDASALILISLFFGFNIFSNQALSVDEITALISIILFLNSPIRELGRVQEYYQGAKLSLNKVQELYKYSRIVRGRQAQQKMRHYNGTVRVKNLHLENIFNGLNFNIKAGEHVALTGKNGSGKSTLLELLLGLIKPDQGTISINGITPMKMLAHEKAKHLGTVGLNIVLLKDSLKNNIKYRHSKLSNKEIRAAIKLCQLEKLVKKLPKGINSTVNESGKNFSSGEKARLSLCRAIVASPSILLLDEPENYLDAEGLTIIKKLIKTYTATLIIATHNKELIQLCQRRINLDKYRNKSETLQILKKNV